MVVTSNDVENPEEGNDVWLADDEDEEGWEATAKGFTRVSLSFVLSLSFSWKFAYSIREQGDHSTTLFSLISLNHTPNLEVFWKEVRSSSYPLSKSK